MVCNVPLNDKLAKVLPAATDMETQWRDYRGPWTRWNHVRTLCLFARGGRIHRQPCLITGSAIRASDRSR